MQIHVKECSSLLSWIPIIQRDLKAPKGQRNSYGGFNYRSCEDILEAVKPITTKYGLMLIISDEIEQVGERYYIKATATIADSTGSYISNTAYAREELSRTKMDVSQITGAASSYARKYALNGLFAIDDTKDEDATNKGQDEPKKPKEPNKPQEPTKPKEPTKAQATKQLQAAKTVEELKELFAALPDTLRQDADIVTLCREKANTMKEKQTA